MNEILILIQTIFTGKQTNVYKIIDMCKTVERSLISL